MWKKRNHHRGNHYILPLNAWSKSRSFVVKGGIFQLYYHLLYTWIWPLWHTKAVKLCHFLIPGFINDVLVTNILKDVLYIIQNNNEFYNFLSWSIKLSSHDNKVKHNQKKSSPLWPWFGVIIVIHLNYFCRYFHII